MAKLIESVDRPRAIAYCRVSSARQATEGGSLEAQREACIRHAVLTGLDLVDVFADGGISGGKDETKRPGLAAALEALRSGRASVLLVKHADRLSRDSDLAGYLRHEVKKAKGSLVVLDEAKDDPIRNAVDKMLAELERIRGSQRMKFFHATRKAKGLHSGRIPYGFEAGADGVLVAVAEEAPIVARIRAERGAGRTLRALALELNREGVPTRTGKPWNPQTILNIEKGGR